MAGSRRKSTRIHGKVAQSSQESLHTSRIPVSTSTMAPETSPSTPTTPPDTTALQPPASAPVSDIAPAAVEPPCAPPEDPPSFASTTFAASAGTTDGNHNVWTENDVDQLVQYIESNSEKAGEGGNFPMTFWQGAAAHVNKFVTAGTPKTGKTVKEKFRRALKMPYATIKDIISNSGWGTWHDILGANVPPTGALAHSWDDYVSKHPNASPFRNKGWKYWERMVKIMPYAVSSGANRYCPTTGTLGRGNGLRSASAQSMFENGDYEFYSPQDFPDHDVMDDLFTPTISTPTTPGPRTSTGKRKAPDPPSEPSSTKRARATAFDSLAASLDGLGASLVTAMSQPLVISYANVPGPSQPSSQAMFSGGEPSPVRRSLALQRAQELESDWLSESQLLDVVEYLEAEKGAAETYLSLAREGLRRGWLTRRLPSLRPCNPFDHEDEAM